ncbi:MAG: hypothetical protein ACON35_08350 [Candidatus Marinamargulisbacteria bacterium]
MELNEPMDVTDIVTFMCQPDASVESVADKVYHANKSLGLTYTAIRQHLYTLPPIDQKKALTMFVKVIAALNSPLMFLDEDH